MTEIVPEPEGEGGLTPQREALLRMNAIVHPELREPLAAFGVETSPDDDPSLDRALDELLRAASGRRSATDPAPVLPRHTLAQAALSLAADRGATSAEELLPIADRL